MQVEAYSMFFISVIDLIPLFRSNQKSPIN